MDKRRKEKKDPSADFITTICALYNDSYDDREEESSLGGADWQPGVLANHTSLVAFQKELRDVHGISLSTAKIRKILITGGCWSTERSREVAELYEKYQSISRVASELGVTDALVTMYLPYGKSVYDLEDKSGNARRIERWREKKSQSKHDEQEQMNPRDAAVKVLYENRETADATLNLWKAVIAFAGDTFTTSGRGVRPGVDFTYRVSEPGQAGGRHYSGTDIPGYGNEMWISINGQEKEKSISRSTVELGYRNAMKLMDTEGCVRGPKALGVPGAGSYLYSLFLRFGVITKAGGSDSD